MGACHSQCRHRGELSTGFPAARLDGRPFATLAEAAPQFAERTLTVNGVSKTYAGLSRALGMFKPV